MSLITLTLLFWLLGHNCTSTRRTPFLRPLAAHIQSHTHAPRPMARAFFLPPPLPPVSHSLMHAYLKSTCEMPFFSCCCGCFVALLRLRQGGGGFSSFSPRPSHAALRRTHCRYPPSPPCRLPSFWFWFCFIAPSIPVCITGKWMGERLEALEREKQEASVCAFIHPPTHPPPPTLTLHSKQKKKVRTK